MLAYGTLSILKEEVLMNLSVIIEVGYSPWISYHILPNIVMSNNDRYDIFREFSINFYLSNLLSQDSRDSFCTDCGSSGSKVPILPDSTTVYYSPYTTVLTLWSNPAQRGGSNPRYVTH